MERDAKFIIGLCVFGIMVLVISTYAYLQSRQFLQGPQVTVTSPKDGDSFTDSLISVEGTAKNISYITLNDNPIFIDSTGAFSEKLLLAPGYNILTIKTQDRFGKKVQKTLELVYRELPKEPVATSSPASVIPANSGIQSR